MKKLLLILFCISFIYAKVDILTISPSSWIVTGKDESLDKASYFNKLSADAYFSFGQLKANLVIPFAYTYEAHNEEYQIGVADISWYLGWQFNSFQPRIGMVIPGIYSIEKSWIGSQDLRFLIGMAFQPHLNKNQGATFSFETAFYPYISSGFGFADAGSWELNSIAKGSYNFANGIHLNLEFLFNVSSMEWKWTTPDREFKITAVPVLSASYDINSLIELGIKGGFGPTFSRIGDTNLEQTSQNISFGLYCNLNF